MREGKTGRKEEVEKEEEENKRKDQKHVFELFGLNS